MPNARYAAMSVEELKKEIARRQRALPGLIARREALDKLIRELQGLSDAYAKPKRVRKRGAGRGAMRLQDQGPIAQPAKADELADKLAEVLALRKRRSLAEQILLGNEAPLRAAAAVFKDRSALKRYGRNSEVRVLAGVTPKAPAPAPSERSAPERMAPSLAKAGTQLHLADEHGQERGQTLSADRTGPKAYSAVGNAHARLLRAVTYEDVFAPHP